MPRTYGTTNVMAYATAPPVGAVGDEYYNITSKQLFLSDGTAWNAVQGAGGGGGAPYAPVQATAPPAASPTIAPPVGLLWVDTSTPNPLASNLVYYQTLTAPAAGSPVTVTHNLGTIYIQVQMWDSVTGLLVGTQVQIIDANNIRVSVAQSMPNAVNVVVMGQTSPGPPVNPPDYATKLYVDQRTPNLPQPITSGSGVQSFTDALGDVWVAANGANAGAWRRARDVMYCKIALGTAIALQTAQISLLFDTAVRDVYGMWGGGQRINLPIPGLWRLDVNAVNNATVVQTMALWMWLGGANLGFYTNANAQTTGFGGYTGWVGASQTVYIPTPTNFDTQWRASTTTGQLVNGTNMTYAVATYLGTG